MTTVTNEVTDWAVADPQWDACGIDLFKDDEEELARRKSVYGDEYVPTPTPEYDDKKMSGKFYKWWLGDPLQYYPVVHDDQHPRREGWWIGPSGMWISGRYSELAEKYITAAEALDEPHVHHKRVFEEMRTVVNLKTNEVGALANNTLGAPRELSEMDQRLVVYDALLAAQEAAAKNAALYFKNEVARYLKQPLKKKREE